MDNQEHEKKNDTIHSYETKHGIKKRKKSNMRFIMLFSIIGVVIVTGILIAPQLLGGNENQTEIITISTLEKIINISELSTFQAVYNGVARGMNEKKPDQLDYYVSYEAKVYAGFDYEKVSIQLNDEVKKITITIPNIEIIDVNVDIATLDYIFENDKANTGTLSSQAYKLCITDATRKSEEEAAIYDLAKQNAKNIMSALISPFIEQLETDYELEIIFGGV